MSIFLFQSCKVLAGASALALFFPCLAQAQDAGLAPEHATRVPKEKENRKARKLEICKAFAAPADGPAINCSVTKT